MLCCQLSAASDLPAAAWSRSQVVGAAALVWFSHSKAGRLRPSLVIPNRGEGPLRLASRERATQPGPARTGAPCVPAAARARRDSLTRTCARSRHKQPSPFTHSPTHPPTRPLPHPPADLLNFARTMGPLAVAYVCKNTCYVVLQTAAAGLDTFRLAAHQVRDLRALRTRAARARAASRRARLRFLRRHLLAPRGPGPTGCAARPRCAAAEPLAPSFDPTPPWVSAVALTPLPAPLAPLCAAPCHPIHPARRALPIGTSSPSPRHRWSRYRSPSSPHVRTSPSARRVRPVYKPAGRPTRRSGAAPFACTSCRAPPKPPAAAPPDPRPRPRPRAVAPRSRARLAAPQHDSHGAPPGRRRRRRRGAALRSAAARGAAGADPRRRGVAAHGCGVAADAGGNAADCC